MSFLLVLLAVAAVEPTPIKADEDSLRAIGLPTDSPGLLEFLRQRGQLGVDVAALTSLTDDLASTDPRVQTRAAARLVMHGPAALPHLRRAINDLGAPKRAARARRCWELIVGPEADTLMMRVIRLVAQRRVAGATEGLLAYLPAADNENVVAEVEKALTSLAFLDRKPPAALLAALADALPLRRAVACSALAQADHPEQLDVLRPLLRDPMPGVRLRAALALLRAGSAEAVPTLIDLLGELPAGEWHTAEDALRDLAGPWAPAVELKGDDEIARGIRRDVWAVWWRHTEGAALLAEFRKRTLTPAETEKAAALIEKFRDDDFDVRTRAVNEVVALGTRVLPQLAQAQKGSDLERANRAKECIERIHEEAKPLPAAAVRLLSLRKPEGALQALLDYVPYAEDAALVEEVRGCLPTLGGRRGEPDALLVRALDDKHPQRRLLAAEALVRIAAAKMQPAVRRLLKDPDALVRLRVALLLVGLRDKSAIPVLIAAQAEEPSELQAQALDVLERVAGEKAPEVAEAEATPSTAAARKKVRDAWAAWWKTAAATVEVGDPAAFLGYTLLVESPRQGNGGRVRELGLDGKPRWVIGGLNVPLDAHVIGTNRVLIAELGGNCVTERDFKGNILWRFPIQSPTNCQRLPGGNTFISTVKGFYEVDRAGKQIWHLAYNAVDGGVKGANGVITCITGDNRVVRLLPTGQELKVALCKRRNGPLGGIDLLPNGHVLVAQVADNSVAEFDPRGNLQWTVRAPGIMSATGLPGGNVLIASQSQGSVTEIDRSGRVVGSSKSDWGILRARRR